MTPVLSKGFRTWNSALVLICTNTNILCKQQRLYREAFASCATMPFDVQSKSIHINCRLTYFQTTTVRGVNQEIEGSILAHVIFEPFFLSPFLFWKHSPLFLILSAFHSLCQLLRLVPFPHAEGGIARSSDGVSSTQKSDLLVADHFDSIYKLQTVR